MPPFIRNRDKALADDALNPGALNVGLWAKRYGCCGEYEYGGNTTAVFPTRAHGIAALIELIMNNVDQYGAVTVRDYICGSNRVPERKSYSGGQKHYADSYLKAMNQMGVDPDEVVNGSIEQMKRLVNAHTFAEGGKEENTPLQFMVAFALLQERSPNIEGTEILECEVA